MIYNTIRHRGVTQYRLLTAMNNVPPPAAIASAGARRPAVTPEKILSCRPAIRPLMAPQSAIVVGMYAGRFASKDVTSASWRSVRPMSSSPSNRRQRV